MSQFHRDAPTGDIHIIQNFTYANATAREGASLSASDVGKIAKQSDDNTYWVLTDDSPLTWKEITAQGGGGSGVGEWHSGTSAPAPTEDTENDQKVWKFVSGGSQKLFAVYKVPNTYVSGRQIKLKIEAYSPSTSNTFLIRTLSSLIRKNTDAVGSTTNQHTSTNSALTNTVANQSREVELDLTDSSGQINSVSVSAGDVLEIDLYRGTDTDTADVRVRAESMEVTIG